MSCSTPFDCEATSFLTAKDPCRWQPNGRHGAIRKTCEHFEKCKSGYACQRFLIFASHGDNEARYEQVPRRYYWFKNEFEPLPKGHRCCKECGEVMTLDAFGCKSDVSLDGNERAARCLKCRKPPKSVYRYEQRGIECPVCKRHDALWSVRYVTRDGTTIKQWNSSKCKDCYNEERNSKWAERSGWAA